MANGSSVGKLAAQLALDSREFEQSMKKAEALAKAMKMHLQEIGKLSIDPSGKLIPSIDQHNKKTTEGSKAIVDFRREQSRQQFVVREATQAISGMVFAMALLNSGNEKASVTQKKVTDGLLAGVAAMNAAEFSFFAISRAGEKLPGMFGRMATGLGKYGGAIGAVIGVSVALFQVFDRSAEKAEAAAKAQERYNKAVQDSLAGLTRETLQKDLEHYQKLLTEEEANLKDLQVVIKTHTTDVSGMTAVYQESTKGSEMDIKVSKERIRTLKEDIAARKEAIAALNQQDLIERRRAASPEARRQAEFETDLEERAAAAESLREINEDVLLDNIDILAISRQQVEVGNITLERYREILQNVLATTAEEDKRLAIQQEIKAVTDAIAHKEQIALTRLSSGIRELGSALDALDLKSHTVLSRMIIVAEQMIRIAQLAKAIEAADAAGQDSGGEQLGFLASVLKIGAAIFGFQHGGYTGSGSARSPAGIVHRGEVVFEKPIVDRNFGDLMKLRSLLQKGFTVPQAVAASGGGSMSTAALEREMRRMVRAVETLPSRMQLRADRRSLWVAWRDEDNLQNNLKS